MLLAECLRNAPEYVHYFMNLSGVYIAFARGVQYSRCSFTSNQRYDMLPTYDKQSHYGGHCVPMAWNRPLRTFHLSESSPVLPERPSTRVREFRY